MHLTLAIIFINVCSVNWCHWDVESLMPCTLPCSEGLLGPGLEWVPFAGKEFRAGRKLFSEMNCSYFQPEPGLIFCQ